MNISSPMFSILDVERLQVSVDMVNFTVREDALTVLLARRPEGEPAPGRWTLSGGFVDVKQDASLLDCAERTRLEKAGVAAPYLEQLGSWGDARRDPRGWSTTHAYFALMPCPKPLPVGCANSQWLPCAVALPRKLAFDHSGILLAAVERLRCKVEYTSLPAYLLAEPFTLPQLQRTSETVLGRSLDKSAFHKRMLDARYLVEAALVAGDYGRPAMGYRLQHPAQATVFPGPFKAGD